MMKRVMNVLGETGNNCPLHMSVVQSLKPAMSAKKVFIDVTSVKIVLTKKTASKGIIAKCQWKSVTRRLLWQKHFLTVERKIWNAFSLMK